MGKLLINCSIEERKGNCFQCAVEYIMYKQHDALLVHGICYGTGGNAKGKWFVHAWTETYDRKIVYDPVYNQYFIRQNYYDAGQISEQTVKTYSFEQLKKMLRKHETYGPWLKRFLKSEMLR